MIHEVKQILWVNTPHGTGLVLFIMDYGIHENSIWIVANQEDGRVRHYETNQITVVINHTINFNLKKA